MTAAIYTEKNKQKRRFEEAIKDVKKEGIILQSR